MMTTTIVKRSAAVFAALGLFAFSAPGLIAPASAYDGTNCRAPGDCWEPKPGYPEQIEGTEYDPQHDPEELNKQQESITEMEERNRQRVEHFQSTGQFVYDVSRLEAGETDDIEPDESVLRPIEEDDSSIAQ